MKKIYALLLALCLLLGLAACGSAAPAAATETKPQEAPAPAAEAPAVEAPAAEPAGQESLRGVLTDNAYENALLNLRIALPAGWVFYSDEQIAQVNNVTADLLSGSDIADIISSNGSFTDMIMGDVTGNNLNVILQPKQKELAQYSDEQIFAMGEETFRAQFSAAGLELTTYESLTMTVGGQERTVLHLVMGANGVQMDEYQIWYRNETDYMGILTIALMQGSDVQPILDGITPLK